MNYKLPGLQAADGPNPVQRQKLSPGLIALILYLCAFLFVPGCAGSNCGSATDRNPLDIIIFPDRSSVAGQSVSMTLSSGSESGENLSVGVRLEVDSPLTIDPTQVLLLGAGDSEPITVTIPAGTTPGVYTVRAINSRNSDVLDTATVTVTEEAGVPTFTFTADPLIATSEPNQFSAPVTFTLTSVNGFTGDVSVDWENTAGASPNNADPKPFVVNLSSGESEPFTRLFYRYETGADIPITFTATSGTITRTVTITTRDAP